MRQYDPSRPIIYTHIPKCAGTSVVRLLRSWFGETYHKLNQDETKDILLPRVPTQDDEGQWLENVKCIHGHFNHGRGYGLPYFYSELDQYFTILRDPFDLTCSMYFFAKGRSIRGEFWFRGEQVDIRDQFPTVESYFSSYPYWLFNHLPQDINLDNYKERLSQRFVDIGVFEDLQQSLYNLCILLSKPKSELPLTNVSNYDEVVPNYLREKFYHDYPLLKKIYNFALENYRTIESQSPAVAPAESDHAAASKAG